MAARWVITADLVTDSVCHMGGETEGPTDMPLLRDDATGRPLLPGSSLAGALRSHLADVLGGYFSPEPSQVVPLFGAARGSGENDSAGQSSLIVFDSLGVLPKNSGSEFRDGVAIDPQKGTAIKHKKFDMEVLPRGTTFPLRFDLVVPESDEEPSLVGQLQATLEGLSASEISVGARRSRGLGAVHTADWRAHRFDLGTAAGWKEWLLSPHTLSDTWAIPCKSFAEARAGAWKREVSPVLDQRKRATFLVNLQLAYARDTTLRSTMLIRSAGIGEDEPDVTHLSSGSQSVVPGTSLAGVLRNRALKIAQQLHNGDAEAWVEAVFGTRDFETDSTKKQLKASRLRALEASITGNRAERLRVSRIRIDRFSHAVSHGALFEQEVQEGGVFNTKFELRFGAGTPEPQRKAQIGLVLLTLRDLVDGFVPIGGSSGVGSGFVTGALSAAIEDDPLRSLETTNPSDDTIQFCDGFIQAFKTASLDRDAQ